MICSPKTNNRLASASYPDPSPMPGGPISVSYGYDDSGHCVSEGVERKYEWDYAGRLRSFRNQAIGATEPTQYVQYLYDASGQRVKKLNRKQLGSDWDVVVYIDGVMEQRTQQRGATTKQGTVLHVLDGGKRLGMRRTGETLDAKPENLLILSDHLGSGSVELDWSLGDFLDREEFRPYGETSFGSYAHKRYRFTGKERDEESGLNYHGARYYAPGLARWMSPDPKGLVDGVNLYGYVRGNPVGLSDPTGTESQPDSRADRTQKSEGGVIQSQKATGVLSRAWNWLTTPVSDNIQQQNDNVQRDRTLLRGKAEESGSLFDWFVASVATEEYGPAPSTPLEFGTIGLLAGLATNGKDKTRSFSINSKSTKQDNKTELGIKAEPIDTRDKVNPKSSTGATAQFVASSGTSSVIKKEIDKPSAASELREAIRKTLDINGTSSERGEFLNREMVGISQRHDWAFTTSKGYDGSYIFCSRRAEAIVISPNGELYKGYTSPLERDFLLKGNSFQPVYDRLKPIEKKDETPQKSR